MYEYRATIMRVVDGDTVHADVDLGFDIRVRMKFRLTGINAPELNTDAGKMARAHLIDLLGMPPEGMGQPVMLVRTEKDRQEKYGRYLATLLLPDGTSVNQRMVADGFAAVYP